MRLTTFLLAAAAILCINACVPLTLPEEDDEATNGTSSSNNGNNQQGGATASSNFSTIPEEHNGHVAVWTETTAEGETSITLISLYDWGEMPSANHEEKGALVSEVAKNYQEFDLTDWRLPTAEEAKLLKVEYGEGSEKLETLNKLLESVEALPLQVKVGTENARYLCEEGTKSFSLATGSTISNAGSKSENYRLRLFKTIKGMQ